MNDTIIAWAIEDVQCRPWLLEAHRNQPHHRAPLCLARVPKLLRRGALEQARLDPATVD